MMFFLWFGHLVNHFVDEDFQFIGPYPGYSVCLFDKLPWGFTDYGEELRYEWRVSFM